jgi:hypothetical protein
MKRHLEITLIHENKLYQVLLDNVQRDLFKEFCNTAFDGKIKVSDEPICELESEGDK